MGRILTPQPIHSPDEFGPPPQGWSHSGYWTSFGFPRGTFPWSCWRRSCSQRPREPWCPGSWQPSRRLVLKNRCRCSLRATTYQNDLKKHLLVHLHELLIPFINISGLATVVIVITSARRVILMMITPLDNLLKDCFIDLERRWAECFCWVQLRATYVGDRNRFTRIS